MEKFCDRLAHAGECGRIVKRDRAVLGQQRRDEISVTPRGFVRMIRVDEGKIDRPGKVSRRQVLGSFADCSNQMRGAGRISLKLGERVPMPARDGLIVP